MTTQTINFQTLATELKITPKRAQTIYTRLFGDIEVSGEVAKPHIEAVIQRIKKSNETVFEACDGYKLEVTKQHQSQQPISNKTNDKPGKGSVSALLESDRSATRKLSQKRYAAIMQESNKLLADWLTNGLPDDELSDELENSIFDSDDMVLDALTEVIDSQGVYSYPKALNASPSSNSIAALLLPSAASPTPNTSNGNGKH
jgi:hypothetical protein